MLGGLGSYFAQSTPIGNASNRLLGDTSENPHYTDLLAIWDAFNGTAQNHNANGTPQGWDSSTAHWSATPSGSGRAIVLLTVGLAANDGGNTNRHTGVA
ncbi:MAG: hypothetical protein P5702_25260 [Limnospira sp. PMC 1291.21]|uniref:Uncharacterized protein n=2 Tax=Limnospira TaxID=2596745 RepID=B5VWL3_LIMMA|nr:MULTISPECIES: hypothetical protein [Limnospira]QJB25468.1 hypothetical protein HFV01_06325 [Limnospira fusiformis SAG 85.79]UWU47262.1 hypothetical protein APLC1_2015 [Arthrospira platensis C1]EDZ96239.1 hypothetical protein AmaxDRAFT_0905 [Limnospira maxima CS-328]MDT9180855.1 hypothetical protein [Limnospira sp. PMC 1238.20]MDT9196182.1 hypothetical protein [Limnospira sp. PMC 1245.20]